MAPTDTQKLLEGLTEELASREHDRWARWQRYLHDKCEQLPDGSLRIPAGLVAHWETQIATPYGRLSEEEKESDREQVREYLPLIAEALGAAKPG